jgi:hypothetical protein
MSYLHCPTCKRAFNIATSPTCPSCPVAAELVDAADDIVTATEQLARAMARATPDERADAMARMDRLALPAPGAKPTTFHGAMVRTIREALVPTTPPGQVPPRKRSLLERITVRASKYVPLARELASSARAQQRALSA